MTAKSFSTIETIETRPLLDFYLAMYPQRAEALPRIWQWLNRPRFCGNNSPLLLLCENRVIGHGGRIPFYLQLGDRRLLASWFVDFAILPSFQGQGLGKDLTSRWMDFGEVGLAIGGYENSFSLFRKLGWIESAETHLLYFLARPLDHPKLEKYVPRFLGPWLNDRFSSLLERRYKKFSPLSEILRWEALEEKHLSFFEPLCQKAKDIAEPFRDREYLIWRLLSSPDREKYFIVSIGDLKEGCVLVKKRRDKKAPFLDLLLLSRKPEDFDFLRLVAALGEWCCRHKMAYLRYYTTRKEIVRDLKPLRPVVRQPRFAFFAKEKNVLEALKQCHWHWELIDSDFEFA